MPSIHLRGLSYAHTSAIPILSDVTLDLATPPNAPSWIGVVGANGSGKTTLLRLVAGALAPARGGIDVHAALAPVLVPQEVGRIDEAVRTFAWTWDGRAEALRSRLDLDPDDLDPSTGRGWSALSPGQRKRWQVATALAAEPDVLLLDEPTNHLDADARDLLIEVLAAHRGLGLVVSHDRWLLDRLTDRTLRIHDAGAELHAGAYTEAAARWRAEEATRRQAHVRARREARRQERILADARRDRHSVEARNKRGRRLAGASQPDAREAGRKAAQNKAAAELSARVGQLRTRVERAHEEAEAIDVRRDHRGAVRFEHRASGRRTLVTVSGDLTNGAGERWLYDVDLALERGEHVHVRGDNGAGKTTLLLALSARLDATGEEVTVLPQELADPVAEVGRVRSLDPEQRGRVLGVAARLGVDPDRVLVTDRPSPGEARKLVLAHALAGTSSVVVLDEPTNHLDLPAIEALEQALRDYPGALVLVTHDEHLAAAVAGTVWTVADKRVDASARPRDRRS